MEQKKNLTRGYVSLGDVFFDKRLRVRASYAFNVSGGAYRVPAIASIPSGATGITATFTDGSPITNGAEVGWSGRNAYLTQYGRLRAEYDWNDYDTTTATLIITKISASQHDPISYLKGPNGGTVYGYGYETPGANGGSTPGYYNPFVGSGWIGFREEYNYIASVSHKHNFTENTSLDIILSSVTLNSQWADGCDGQDNCQAPGKNPTTQGQGSFMFGGNGTAMHNFATNNYFSAIINHKFNDRHLLLIGFQGRVDNANNSFSLTPNYRAKQFWKTYEPAYQDINFSVYTLAAFGNWQANWNKWVSTNMGLRLDYWKNYNISTFDRNNPHNPNLQTFKGVEEFFPSPKFAINITPHKYTTIKGSIGLAFHAPNTRQIFNNTDSGVFQVQNPALGPEYGLQFDIGIEQRNPYGGVAKVFYYQTEMYNGIFPSGLGTRQHPIKNLNGARSRFQGVEIEIEQKIYGGLYFMANYTYTRAILVKDPSQPENEGHQYPFIPRQMGGFSINYGDEGPGFYGSIQAQGQGVAYINFKNLPQHLAFGNITPRLLINIKAGWNFKNGTHISATFLNITNEKYYDYYRGSGASFYVEFGGKFF
ncbi:TonB-dependent receptor protein [Helicobacter mustelae]|uniref:TonB-dependent receptor n=1 Tax=Helicobacter mustelae TaxID=217 RepID=UPI000E04771F|nr:TonB-dependent receptor [Helicobacter mustelae]STP12203.1 TonB-dependent receptor protein [Helicobacter mustelae]